MSKSIWLPVSDTKVTVQDGKVTVWDEMKMIEKPLTQPNAAVGFTQFMVDAHANPR